MKLVHILFVKLFLTLVFSVDFKRFVWLNIFNTRPPDNKMSITLFGNTFPPLTDGAVILEQGLLKKAAVMMWFFFSLLTLENCLNLLMCINILWLNYLPDQAFFVFRNNFGLNNGPDSYLLDVKLSINSHHTLLFLRHRSC